MPKKNCLKVVVMRVVKFDPESEQGAPCTQFIGCMLNPECPDDVFTQHGLDGFIPYQGRVALS